MGRERETLSFMNTSSFIVFSMRATYFNQLLPRYPWWFFSVGENGGGRGIPMAFTHVADRHKSLAVKNLGQGEGGNNVIFFFKINGYKIPRLLWMDGV